jgi:site-specific recombinase XerD
VKERSFSATSKAALVALSTSGACRAKASRMVCVVNRKMPAFQRCMPPANNTSAVARLGFSTKERSTCGTGAKSAVGFLFCPIYRGRAVNRDLSTTTVKRLVKSAAKAAGLDPEEIDAFSGHSLRVGAAQDLLCAGYDAAAIMRAGGWKSVNILGRYLEMADHNVWA